MALEWRGSARYRPSPRDPAPGGEALQHLVPPMRRGRMPQDSSTQKRR